MDQKLPEEFQEIKERCLSAGMRPITFTFLCQMITRTYDRNVKEHSNLMAARCIETIVQELVKEDSDS